MATKKVKIAKTSVKAYLFDVQAVKAKMDAKIARLTAEAQALLKDAQWIENQEAIYKKAISLDVNSGEDGDLVVELESEGAEKVTVDGEEVKKGEDEQPKENKDGNPFTPVEEEEKIDDEIVKLEARKKALLRRKANLNKK